MAHELKSRDFIYRGRVFDVSTSRYQSAARGEVAIEVVHHNGGSGIIALYDDATVALARQWRYPIERYSLEIAAGRIEPGQTPEETAIRELEEELGLKAENVQKLAEFNVAPGYCEERLFVYLATGLQSASQNLDDDEEIEVVRIPFFTALEKVRAGEIDDAKSIIAFLTAEPIVRAKFGL